VYLFEPGKMTNAEPYGAENPSHIFTLETVSPDMRRYKPWFAAGKGTRNNMESFETNFLINKEGYRGLWTRCTRPSGN
jgi:hypothetical protein